MKCTPDPVVGGVDDAGMQGEKCCAAEVSLCSIGIGPKAAEGPIAESWTAHSAVICTAIPVCRTLFAPQRAYLENPSEDPGRWA